MRAPKEVVLGLLLAGFPAGVAAACSLPAGTEWKREATPQAQLAWRTIAPPIRVGQAFAVEVAACLKGGVVPRKLTASADMPAHGHGMNYRPTIKRLSPGRWRFEGFLFHMPGRWRVVFDVYGPAGRKRVTTSLDLVK